VRCTIPRPALISIRLFPSHLNLSISVLNPSNGPLSLRSQSALLLRNLIRVEIPLGRFQATVLHRICLNLGFMVLKPFFWFLFLIPPTLRGNKTTAYLRVFCCRYISPSGRYVCVGAPSHVRSFVISFPVFSFSSLLFVSHLASRFGYCLILSPFCLHAGGHRLSFVDTMSLIACRSVLSAFFYCFSLLYPIDMPCKVGGIFFKPHFIAGSHLIHHTIVRG